MSYDVEYSFGQLGSDVLVVAPPQFLLAHKLISREIKATNRGSFNAVQALLSKSQSVLITLFWSQIKTTTPYRDTDQNHNTR